MKKYVEELENLIQDVLLPGYILGCRAAGTDPKTHAILIRLLAARKLKRELPYLLISQDSVMSRNS